MADKIIVIGNGPSLRGFDLRTLRGVDTLGMNAAYRHWDRIGWYPDIYACLDDQVINTHWKEIRRLIDSGCVKQAFLSGQFLTFVPEAVRDPRYRFLDSFVKHWHRVRGAALGLEQVIHPAFSTSAPNKITTGSYAVRYAIACGYQRIALLGIDLKYIERIPEAHPTGGIRLEMGETPLHNPNYFFDDYQRAGDTFQVPNPDVHDGDLHLASFVTLRDDAVTFKYDVQLVNTSLQSVLHEQGVVPYQALEDFLDRRVLGAVVVPTNAREIDAILDNIWLWDQPAFAPFLHLQNRERPRLVYCFNNETGKNVEPAIVEAFSQTSNLRHCFDSLQFRYLSLYGDRDLYVRGGSERAGPQGFKAGPNNQFIETIRTAADLGKFIFYMETDCLPIRADWLGGLQDLVQNMEPFWVLGSIYRGSGRLGRAYARHINGNAVYATGDPEFRDFVATIWQPELEHLAARDPVYAYDMVPETIFDDLQSDAKDDPNWRLLQATAHKFRYTDIIRNYAGPNDATAFGGDLVRQILRESPTTCLVHGRAFAHVARWLREATGVPIAAASFQLMPTAARRAGVAKDTREGQLTMTAQENMSTPIETADVEPRTDSARDLESRVAALELAVAALDADTSPYRKGHRPANYQIATEMKRRYWQAVREIHDLVATLVPHDATVLVISRGDDLLLNLDGRRAWHFPRSASGGYAGYHPADSAAVIGELEVLRTRGADFLIVPATAFWWFDYYQGFTRHLDERYVRLDSPDCCAIYRLSAVAVDEAVACRAGVGTGIRMNELGESTWPR